MKKVSKVKKTIKSTNFLRDFTNKVERNVGLFDGVKFSIEYASAPNAWLLKDSSGNVLELLFVD